MESPDELATALGEAVQALREDPEGSFAEFSVELSEVDRQMLEQPDVRALIIEMFQEGGVGVRRVGSTTTCARYNHSRSGSMKSGSTCGSTMEKTIYSCPRTSRRRSLKECQEADCTCTQARDISPSADISRRSWRPCLPPIRNAAVHIGSAPGNAIH